MKKGFTLIELLAVIVILAIIALIATPIILGIINDAREDSNKRSVENYAHAVELAVARYSSSHGGNLPKEGTYKIINDGKGLENLEDFNIDYKGEKIEGYVTITSDGKITLDASFDGGKTTYNYSEKDGVTKSEGENTEVSSPFKVTKDGVLMHYERQSDETSVVVPAEVNGIKIKGIFRGAFMPGDVIVFISKGLVIGLTEKANNLKQMADQNNLNFVMIEEFIKQNDSIGLLDLWSNDMSAASDGMQKGYIDESAKDILVPVEHYLTDIDLSGMKYLETIGMMAFFGETSDGMDYQIRGLAPLKSVKLPMNGNLKTIGLLSFYGNKLTDITIPSTVTTIEDEAFLGNEFTEIIIPSSVTTIGAGAFRYNQNLTKITIKKANSDGMNLIDGWNYNAEVVYDPS